MTPPGNYVCIFLVVLETFLFNGVFAGWGILTAMLKEDELFFHEESWNGLHFQISAHSVAPSLTSKIESDDISPCSLTSSDENLIAECIDKRDRMFNDIFLYSNFALNIGCLIVGLIIDRFVRKFVKLSRYESYHMTHVQVQTKFRTVTRFGMFVGRFVSSVITLLGYILLIFIIKEPLLLWIAWPLMAWGGLRCSFKMILLNLSD